MKTNSNNQGFTLLELLIVLIFLGGVLTLAFSLFPVSFGRARAETSAREFFSIYWANSDYLISCNRDSDRDGYASCTGIREGESLTKECPTNPWIGETCRDPENSWRFRK